MKYFYAILEEPFDDYGLDTSMLIVASRDKEQAECFIKANHLDGEERIKTIKEFKLPTFKSRRKPFCAFEFKIF